MHVGSSSAPRSLALHGKTVLAFNLAHAEMKTELWIVREEMDYLYNWKVLSGQYRYIAGKCANLQRNLHCSTIEVDLEMVYASAHLT